MLANPVCLEVDRQGRVYVAETFRHQDGVLDTRDHMEWLSDDLACRTVADREAMMRRYLPEREPDYTREHERIRRLVDTDGDGKADVATVFAEGFAIWRTASGPAAES